MEVALRQFKIPSLRAIGGKTKNWMNMPKMPYIVNRTPILPESRLYISNERVLKDTGSVPIPKPPENFNGSFTSGLLRISCGV